MNLRDSIWVVPYRDSVLVQEHRAGMVLENPVKLEPAPEPKDTSISWIYLVFAVLFCAVGLRFRGSGRYLHALLADLTQTRERGNVFDDTVRETSFLILLNVLWSACAGVLLWTLIQMPERHEWWSFSIPDRPAAGMGLCMGISAAYVAVMMMAYWMVGLVFTDARKTESWIKGAAASTGLETLVLFPVALLLLCQPEWTQELLIIGACAFILGKIMFIFKGFRIFFTRFSSWLLFLYYLCSLEIVPLILVYVLTLQLCVTML